MSWTRLDIPCPPAFAELVAALVFVETGRGASLCEGVSETIVQAWTPTYRAAETQVRLTKRLSDINVALAEAAHSMTKVEIRDEDWSLGWRRHFKPLRVGKRLVVKPLWESWPSADAPDAARPDDLLIEID
ncbi:MAG: 50S ribosomal protein L11 methyltransferase, partial [Candidatus Zipacnadales bacterium]